MNNANDDRQGRIPSVKAIVSSVVIAYAATIATYILVFAREGCCNQEYWGQFGDFVGGLLNPLLGLMSVFLLAMTLREQRSLMNETRQQALIDELQRFVASIGNELDEELAQPLSTDSPIAVAWQSVEGILQGRGYTNGLRPSLRDALSAAWGHWTAPMVIGPFTEKAAILIRYDPIFLRLTNRVLLYDSALSEYLSQGGSAEVARLYAVRWGPGVLGIVHLLLSINRDEAIQPIQVRFARYGLLDHSDAASEWLESVR